MGNRSYDNTFKERGRVTANVPAAVGQYAPEVILFGKVGVGETAQSFGGVTALIEQVPAGSVVELWLPKVPDGNNPAAGLAIANGDYFYSGLCVVPPRVAFSATGETASFGSANWLLSGYPGAALRIVNRSGGGGSATISASAY